MTNHNADNAAKSRTIKFRGMRKDNNEWVYGDLVHSALTAFHWEKIEELEVAYIGEYESITGRRLDITYLRKSIELLTKK